MGCKVICIDKELTHFRRKPELDLRSQDRLKVLLLDVLKEPWPFAASTLGGIIIVDFLPWKLFPRIVESLIPSGCMLLETVSGRGGNFRELPRAGQLKAIFEGSIIIEDYKEKYVGPRTTEAVTVKMIGRRGR